MINTENMYTLLIIDAWRDPDGGWIWNNWFLMEEDIHIAPDTSTRALLNMLRPGYLSDSSKGRVCVEDDGYNIVIMDRGTREPIFALEPQWDM